MTRAPLYILGGLVALVVAFTAGRYSKPAEVKTVLETVYSTRTVRSVVVHREAHTKWRRVTVSRPDGSSTTEEVAERHESEKSAENEQTREAGKTREESKTTQYRPEWSLGVGVGVNVRGDWKVIQPTLIVTAGRRVFGDLWLDVFVESTGTLGVGASLKF